MTEIHIHGPVTIVQHDEMPAKTPSAPSRLVRKPPTDNGGRPIYRDGAPLTVTPAAKRDSGPKVRWRVWPNERPKEYEDILMRFKLVSGYHTMIAYRDGLELFGDSGRLLFRSDADPDDSPTETVFRDHMPATFEWVLLDELLKGVE
jgi:hypothetical protein